MKSEFIEISLKTTTCYLIKADNGYMLIDTGYDKDYDIFLNELNKSSVNIQTINYLLLTHHHDDHAGFVNKLLVDTNLTIICHCLSKDLLKTGENDMSGSVKKSMKK